MRALLFFAQALLIGIFIGCILILIGGFSKAPSTFRDPSTEL
ncbi:hypothetical protein F3D3_3154 [Fusibacter sp. 3D3]|nr:hypothetical protein F3D3_3154 [Fusibacter sp. 3D3]